MAERWLTAQEAAKLLGCSDDWVYILLNSGRLKGERAMGTWLVDPGSVAKFKRKPRGRPPVKKARKSRGAAEAAPGRTL